MHKVLILWISILSFLTLSFAHAADIDIKPAYYIAEFELTDKDGIKPYSAQVENTFKPYSGRFIVRGGDMDVKEGFGAQGKLIVIKFDSLAQAQEWYKSDEYQSIIPFRHRSGNTRTYIVEGLAQ